MRLVASENVLRHIRERSGALYVWAGSERCCRGRTTVLEASTEPPARDFRLVEHGEIDVFFAATLAREPDELHLELRGRRSPRIAAYWNGCAWVV